MLDCCCVLANLNGIKGLTSEEPNPQTTYSIESVISVGPSIFIFFTCKTADRQTPFYVFDKYCSTQEGIFYQGEARRKKTCEAARIESLAAAQVTIHTVTISTRLPQYAHQFLILVTMLQLLGRIVRLAKKQVC